MSLALKTTKEQIKLCRLVYYLQKSNYCIRKQNAGLTNSTHVCCVLFFTSGPHLSIGLLQDQCSHFLFFIAFKLYAEPTDTFNGKLIFIAGDQGIFRLAGQLCNDLIVFNKNF